MTDPKLTDETLQHPVPQRRASWLWSDLVVGGAVVALFVAAAVAPAPLAYVHAFIGENYLSTALVFMLLMFVATVIAPIAVLPLVPVAAPFLGAWQTALLAALGWTLGAVVAFLLARRYGRPLLRRVVNIERLGALEALLPKRHVFWWILLLRMLVPVDVLSYALGLMHNVPVISYVVATALGVLPFAFIFAYSGEAYVRGDVDVLVALGGAGVLLFLVGWRLMRAKRR